MTISMRYLRLKCSMMWVAVDWGTDTFMEFAHTCVALCYLTGVTIFNQVNYSQSLIYQNFIDH